MNAGSGKWPGWMVNSSQVSSADGAALGGNAVSGASCIADADADADPKALLLLLLLVCNDGGPPPNGLLLPSGLLVLTCAPPKLVS